MDLFEYNRAIKGPSFQGRGILEFLRDNLGRFYKPPDSTQFPRYFTRAKEYVPGREDEYRNIEPLWKNWQKGYPEMPAYVKRKQKKRVMENSRYSTQALGKKGIKRHKLKKKHQRRRL
eukprot:jgi/Bigna1/140957/aug1.59_g15665